MQPYLRFGFVFFAFALADVATTLIATGDRGLVESNPFLLSSNGQLDQLRLVLLNPIAAVLLAALAGWLSAGEVGAQASRSRVTWVVAKSALARSGRSSDPAERRAQILVCLYVGLVILIFPIINNAVQMALAPGLLGSLRNGVIAALASVGAVTGAIVIAPRLLVSAIPYRH